MLQRIAILGGGSAGLLAALTLKSRLPSVEIRVLHSREIGVIGVGEGSTVDLPRHLHGFLQLDAGEFLQEVHPTHKLGVRFRWGARGLFDYTFTNAITSRLPHLRRSIGFYCQEEFEDLDLNSALMKRGKAFGIDNAGRMQITNTFGYHVENVRLVQYLERRVLKAGVSMTEGTVVHTQRKEGGIDHLVLASGEKIEADLYVDASGFRSELLGKAMEEPFVSYADSLFCDRALAGGWERKDEPLLPYTTAETMDAGWAWQIEHEHHVHRGYVFSSAFVSDEEAEREFRRKNPKLGPTRLVPFRSGRHQRSWVGNVVAVGNSSGFVEPLEATALLVVCQEARLLATALAETAGESFSTGQASLNNVLAKFWDEICDFLAIHYKFNTLQQTPFWLHCRRETALHGAERIVQCYLEHGPTSLFEMDLLNPTTSLFHLEGFYTLLLGQGVPSRTKFRPTAEERLRWESYRLQYAEQAARGVDLAAAISSLRRESLRHDEPQDVLIS